MIKKTRKNIIQILEQEFEEKCKEMEKISQVDLDLLGPGDENDKDNEIIKLLKRNAGNCTC